MTCSVSGGLAHKGHPVRFANPIYLSIYLRSLGINLRTADLQNGVVRIKRILRRVFCFFCHQIPKNGENCGVVTWKSMLKQTGSIKSKVLRSGCSWRFDSTKEGSHLWNETRVIPKFRRAVTLLLFSMLKDSYALSSLLSLCPT